MRDNFFPFLGGILGASWYAPFVDIAANVLENAVLSILGGLCGVATNMALKAFAKWREDRKKKNEDNNNEEI